MRTNLLAISIAIVPALAGCAGDSAGTPPTPSSATTRVYTPTELVNAPLRRPHELRLNDKDPCTLLPRADWPKFHIDKPGKHRTAEITNAPECFYSNNLGSFTISAIVTEGMTVWRDSSKSAVADDIDAVAGFPAMSLTVPEHKLACSVVVDVASGQYLRATVIPDLSKVPQLPERCEYAHQLATSAMTTLTATDLADPSPTPQAPHPASTSHTKPGG